MPVPSAITDLSTTPASNSPAGSETPSSTDDYLRTLSAFIKQAYDATQSGNTQWCGSSGGTANAITLTPSPAIPAYGAGQVFRFLAATTNTGAVTVAISGLTAIALQVNGAACLGGEIVAGQWYELLLSSASGAQLRTTLAPNLTTAINFKRSTVAATATTTPLWLPSNFNVQDWTGTPTITDFPAAPQAGSQRQVSPAAGTVMTNAGNISVQGNATATAEAGDKWIITAVTATTFYVEIVKKSGVPLASPQIPISVRQAIQYGPTTGAPAVSDLIPQSQVGRTLAQSVIAKFSTAATLISIANGFNADGSPNNNNRVLTADLTAPALTASATNLIAYDYTNNVLVKTTVLDTDTKGGTPAITTGLYTYDYENCKMYLGNGSAANQVQHIILAEVDTNATVITAIRCRAYRGYADTGWFAVAISQLYIKNHLIGTAYCDVDLVWNSTATDDGARNVPQFSISGGSSGASRKISKNTAAFATYDALTYGSTNATADPASSSGGFYRATIRRKY